MILAAICKDWKQASLPLVFLILWGSPFCARSVDTLRTNAGAARRSTHGKTSSLAYGLCMPLEAVLRYSPRLFSSCFVCSFSGFLCAFAVTCSEPGRFHRRRVFRSQFPRVNGGPDKMSFRNQFAFLAA